MKQNSPQAWLQGIRPKTLTAAVIPVCVGAALALADHRFQWIPVLICALFACFMQVEANFINDLFDALKGTDRSDRLGPERTVAQGWITPRAMKRGIVILALTASGTGCLLLFYGGWPLIIVGVLCLLFAFLYTGGPYPLSYYGLGDVLVVVFFGIVPVCCTYYVQTQCINSMVFIASIAVGLVSDSMLIINNYRDRDTDRISNKRTIIVRLGEPFGRYLYLFSGVAGALLCLCFFYRGWVYAALLPQVYLIPHVITWRKMVQTGCGKELNVIFGETSRNMLLLGVLMAAGLIMG